MRFHIEPQQLANRVCEVVFFFLYGLVRVLPIHCFAKWQVHSFTYSSVSRFQKESDQKSFRGVRSKLLSSYQGRPGERDSANVFFETSWIA